MLLSVLQIASQEAQTGTEIHVEISTKPLSEAELSNDGDFPAANIDILDFSMMLVCKITFLHTQSY